MAAMKRTHRRHSQADWISAVLLVVVLACVGAMAGLGGFAVLYALASVR